MRLKNKVAIITGGSRGIGAEICKVLASFGLKVWINYRSNPKLADDLKAQIEAEKVELENNRNF